MWVEVTCLRSVCSARGVIHSCVEISTYNFSRAVIILLHLCVVFMMIIHHTNGLNELNGGFFSHSPNCIVFFSFFFLPSFIQLIYRCHHLLTAANPSPFIYLKSLAVRPNDVSINKYKIWGGRGEGRGERLMVVSGEWRRWCWHDRSYERNMFIFIFWKQMIMMLLIQMFGNNMEGAISDLVDWIRTSNALPRLDDDLTEHQKKKPRK